MFPTDARKKSVDTKEIIDRAISAAALIVLSPLFAVTALAIKLDSSGPVFFRQERIGRFGVPFHIHKFRTMRNEKPKKNISASGDPRVTRAGRILRKTKIDELAQLIDVAQGSMSLVGPRPEVPEYVEQWSQDRKALILSVRPGITDPASIAYRNEADELASAADPERYYTQVLIPKKTKMYADYVRSRSLLGDFRIILQTIATVARG